MSTIFECERTVWKTLTLSIGYDWHCQSFHFAVGKWHPCRITCIWTLLIPFLLCTLGSCDMEISALYFMDNIFSFIMHSVTRCGSRGFLLAVINQKNYPFSNLTQIFKIIYLTCRCNSHLLARPLLRSMSIHDIFIFFSSHSLVFKDDYIFNCLATQRTVLTMYLLFGYSIALSIPLIQYL